MDSDYNHEACMEYYGISGDLNEVGNVNKPVTSIKEGTNTDHLGASTVPRMRTPWMGPNTSQSNIQH